MIEIDSVWAEEGGIRVRICKSPDFPGHRIIQIVHGAGNPIPSQIIGQARVVDYRVKRLVGALEKQ